MANGFCPVCHSEADVNKLGALEREIEVICPCCGHFVVTEEVEQQIDKTRNKVASWLYYHAKYCKKEKRFTSNYFISEKDIGKADTRCVTLEEISNWYPRMFSEKVDRFLEMLAKRSAGLGSMLRFSPESILSASFGKFYFDQSTGRVSVGYKVQGDLFLNYLKEQQYITPDSIIIHAALAPRGWQRVDELQKNNSNNRDVFIAMSFDPKNDDIKGAIKDGIIKAEYSPRIMSEEIHGKQIVPMMFRLIRESKLLVMDVTDPNYGAYHEAGYALGLGKEVIITCREDEFNNPDNKPHFDIAQKQILVWKDYEDLTERLSEWIKAIAG